MLLYQHVLQDLRLAGLTDIIGDTPCDFTQRQERNPFKTQAAPQPAPQAASVTRPAAKPEPKRQVAEPARPLITAEAPAPDLTTVLRLQVQQNAKAWVIVTDNDLTENFFTTPHGDLLGKMLKSIELDVAQVNVLRFAEVHQGRRLSTAHVMQVGEQMATHLKQTALPVLMFGQGALHVMLGHDKPMAAVHGQVLDLPLGQRGVATYHPSILLERAELKRRAWEALCAFREIGITAA